MQKYSTKTKKTIWKIQIKKKLEPNTKDDFSDIVPFPNEWSMLVVVALPKLGIEF